MTNVKSPSVRIFIGNVRINNIGFTNAFMMPIMTPTTSAFQNPVTVTPGNKYDVAKTAIPFTNMPTSTSIPK